MVEHDNTSEKPANGAQQAMLLHSQNRVSSNFEHSETISVDDENKPGVVEKKTYTINAWIVHFFVVLFSLSFIGNIVQGVLHGISLKCPSCAGPCPQGWVVHEAWCYYFSTAEATWNSSQSNCSSQGGSLTAIDTPSEMEFLLNEKKATVYWIGLQREKGQPWKWTNGSYFDPW
ncbi:C-type lectin domain family 2 member D-like [Lacerta agilis]|uniref:C-type lectin domain family 2 member D-like n=1 Tax=Lacerta agilis TaxID=80427 RepID=UPI00141A1037|nr:C-type lectin domain family 2 member D-like [Lacerta agilis]